MNFRSGTVPIRHELKRWRSYWSFSQLRAAVPTGILAAVEVYKAECAEILRRYRIGRITYAECVSALASAVSAIASGLRAENREFIQSTILANNEALEKIRAQKPN
jgi:hypothetical protein